MYGSCLPTTVNSLCVIVLCGVFMTGGDIYRAFLFHTILTYKYKSMEMTPFRLFSLTKMTYTQTKQFLYSETKKYTNDKISHCKVAVKIENPRY